MLEHDPEQARQYFAQKLAFTTGPDELAGMLRRGEPIVLVDVRRPESYRAGHLPQAVNLPQGRWHTLAGLSKSLINVVYSHGQTCRLATAAALEFATAGHRVVELEGGYEAWERYGCPIERPQARANQRRGQRSGAAR